jgi:predicted permease
MRTIWQDVRHGLRSLGRSPGFIAAAVLMLALGIGANTAIFTVFEQLLVRSLPVEDPDSLVIVVTEGKHIGSSWGMHMLSYPMFKDFRGDRSVFDGVLCWRPELVAMDDGRGAQRVAVELVSGGYFDVLGAPPALGRTFVADDETAPGANPVAVLAHDFWRTHFAGDPNIVGRTVLVNDAAVVVVGVAAPKFRGVSLDSRPGMFLPITMKTLVTPWWSAWEDRRTQWVRVLARLKPDLSVAQAQASLQTPYRQMIERETQEGGFAGVSADEREQFLRSRLALMPGARGHSFLSWDLEGPLRRLMMLAALVLLVACANVSCLLIVRGMTRRREIAIRLAMGSGRLRIIRQMLMESLLMALAGGLAALLVSVWTARAVLLFVPGQLQASVTPEISGSVLAFSVILSAVVAVLVGLLPAWRATRVELVSTLKEHAAAVGGGSGTRLRQVLVVVQVGLSLILLIGSGLLIRSVLSLYRVDLGFQSTNLVCFKLDPAAHGYYGLRKTGLCRQVQSDLQAMPGVRSAAFGHVPHLESYAWTRGIVVEGRPAEEGESLVTTCDSISRDYCKTLGIPVKLGREFNESDEFPDAAKVVVVNETFVKRFLPDRNPLGCHIGFPQRGNSQADREIVGVVADFKSDSLRYVRPLALMPHTQFGMDPVTVYVRTSLPSGQLFRAIHERMRGIDAAIPVYDLRTMEDQLDRCLATDRLMGILSSLFGVLATVLAMVGLYAVTAYGAACRVREIGIRMALGAQRWSVLALVLREGMILAGVGIGVGLVVALGMTRVLRNQLFGITPTDPVTFVVTALLLGAVAMLACYLPARRAARIDPMVALRCE